MPGMGPLKVRDLMTAKVMAVGPGEDLATLWTLMERQRVRHMPIVDPAGDLVGLVTHRDLLRHALVERGGRAAALEEAVLERLTAGEIMRSELATIGPDADIRLAAQRMLEHKYGCLPVVVERRLVGILTEADFVRFLAGGD